MLANNEVIILIEKYNGFLRVFYKDRHFEIWDDHFKKYILKKQKGYKKPMVIGDNWLFPTRNMRDVQCCWINLDYFIEFDRYFIKLLNQRHLYECVKKMFLRKKEKG